MSSCQPEGEGIAQLCTLAVEVVVSVSRIPPRLLTLPGLQFLDNVNVKHWGIKIGSGYYDLKMRGIYRTKPGVAFAAPLAARDERSISKSIYIGRTHFTNEEVKEFGKNNLISLLGGFFSISTIVLKFQQQFIVLNMLRGITSGWTIARALQLTNWHVLSFAINAAILNPTVQKPPTYMGCHMSYECVLLRLQSVLKSLLLK